jgi:hypothetical protein
MKIINRINNSNSHFSIGASKSKLLRLCLQVWRGRESSGQKEGTSEKK